MSRLEQRMYTLENIIKKQAIQLDNQRRHLQKLDTIIARQKEISKLVDNYLDPF